MTSARHEFTIGDPLRLPQDGRRYEVIDGELYATPVPHPAHQIILGHIAYALGDWGDRPGHGWSVSGAGVLASRTIGFIPDLVWFSGERLPSALVNRATGGRGRKFHAAPDLVVEYPSPGREEEYLHREIKQPLYARLAVREYWLVARFAPLVEVYRRQQAGLVLAATLLPGDTLTSPLLPGFAMPIEQILRQPEAVQP